jgi:ATP-dependent DNA helicase RecQ
MTANESIELKKALKHYFGFDSFKGLQKGVTESIMDNHNTFAVMPTGGGKSLTYQLPALLKEGTAIVVSPLIALMKNQVDALRGISEEKGIVHVLNSTLNKTETRQVMSDITNGITKMVYVAPESLKKEENVEFLRSVKLSFVAIDEAHCISEWGHDFRPEYGNLRSIIDAIDPKLPIIALTATATKKVQEDILKNLHIQDANVFKASFNRPNLFYEVRQKTADVDKDLIKFIKQREGQSGIIYALSRKTVEQLSQTLQVNGIKAIPYHAGLDTKTRARHQDMFLMQDIDVVVATIAFGMGIDKPDVRFVIHYNMPKSLESYYQETGRAGRDDGEGYCLAYYSYKDMEKLEKFITQNKTVNEKEIAMSLLNEVVAYAETSVSRRQFLLHYFGEKFDPATGEGGDMDDNVRNPKNRIEAKDEVFKILTVVAQTKEIYKPKEIVNTLIGRENALIKSHFTHHQDFFGIGKDKDEYYWRALIRQILVAGLLKKQIENYGILQLTDAGQDFINNPTSFLMTEDHRYDNGDINAKSVGKVAVADEKLLKMLIGLRKDVSKKKNVPPYVIFQEPSLEDMALKYPTTIDELSSVYGVGEGKARKYGKPFVELIAKYVAENDIIRPEDFIVKSTANRSALKIYVIKSTDRKLPLEDIAKTKGLTMDELLKEMEQIVYMGTKLNIDYYLNEIFDEDQLEELHDYFMEAESDKISLAMEEFEGEYEEEELRMFRIKFISEVAN